MHPCESRTNSDSARRAADWVGDLRSYVVAWGLPTALLVAAIWLPHPVKTLIWGAALTWMGLACLANAARCGRTHCWFTAPFFLAMAAASILHGYAIVPLGAGGWRWIGLVTLGGAAALWCFSEALLGRFLPRAGSRHVDEA